MIFPAAEEKNRACGVPSSDLITGETGVGCMAFALAFGNWHWRSKIPVASTMQRLLVPTTTLDQRISEAKAQLRIRTTITTFCSRPISLHDPIAYLVMAGRVFLVHRGAPSSWLTYMVYATYSSIT